MIVSIGFPLSVLAAKPSRSCTMANAMLPHRWLYRSLIPQDTRSRSISWTAKKPPDDPTPLPKSVNYKSILQSLK